MEEPNGTALDSWLDLPHAFLERRIFGIVNGFDRFFADEGDRECRRSGSFLRWRDELRVDERGRLSFGTGVRADIHLPYLEKRLKDLRIVLENAAQGATDSEPRALGGPDAKSPGDAVVRLTFLETLRSSLDLGGGVLLELPPGLVGRLRFRQTFGLGTLALGRLAATGFWNTKVGWGSTASVSLERALRPGLLLRWSNGALVSQDSRGYEGASELALLATLGSRTGVTILGSATGHSKPERVLQVWRVAARLRRDLFRHWIFGEVEPEVTWPFDPERPRRAVPAVMFRLELQFEDSTRKSGIAGPGGCGLASKDESPRGGA